LTTNIKGADGTDGTDGADGNDAVGSGQFFVDDLTETFILDDD